VKVGLEETLAATMMRTGAKIVALRTGLIDVPKSMCYVPQLKRILSIWYFVNFEDPIYTVQRMCRTMS